MSHSTVYRICLLIVVILTIIGGIFYYVNYVESQAKVTEGTLVKEWDPDDNEQIYVWQEREKESGEISWPQKSFI